GFGDRGRRTHGVRGDVADDRCAVCVLLRFERHLTGLQVARRNAGALERSDHGSRRVGVLRERGLRGRSARDRKSTRLNSSHANISYAVFCLKKKKKKNT